MSESTSIKLPDGTRDRLKTVAKRKQRTPNWLMKEAIDQYLKREEAQASFEEEARESLAHYRATGLHLRHEEVEEWFEKLLRGERADPPAPHT